MITILVIIAIIIFLMVYMFIGRIVVRIIDHIDFVDELNDDNSWAAEIIWPVFALILLVWFPLRWIFKEGMANLWTACVTTPADAVYEKIELRMESIANWYLKKKSELSLFKK